MAMTHDGHISAIQGLAMAAVFLAAKTLFYVPGYVVGQAKTAAWLEVLGTGLVTAAVFALPCLLLRRYPGRSLLYATEDALGPWLGLLINLAYFGLLFVMTAFLLRQYVEVFISTVLPNTPPSILALVLIVVILLPAYHGVEALGRTAVILMPMAMLGLLVVLVFNIDRARFYLLFPIWGAGPRRLAMDALVTIGQWQEILVLPVIYSAFRRYRDLLLAGYGGLAVSVLTLAAVVAMLVALFDVEPQPFAVYQMARLVYLGRFLQRIEMYFVAAWFFLAFLQQAIGLYASAVSLSETLHLPYWRPLLFPLAVVAYTLSLLPPDYATLVMANRLFLEYYATGVAYVLPLLALAAALLRRRGTVPHAG